jgi:heme-degrading monooxygenase HmoA
MDKNKISLTKTPEPPYYIVLFSSILTEDSQEYQNMAHKMAELSAQSPGFLGFESARNSIGLTASYWKDIKSIDIWKKNIEHRIARTLGREKFYKAFTVRIAKVERTYSFNKNQ